MSLAKIGVAALALAGVALLYKTKRAAPGGRGTPPRPASGQRAPSRVTRTAPPATPSTTSSARPVLSQADALDAYRRAAKAFDDYRASHRDELQTPGSRLAQLAAARDVASSHLGSSTPTPSAPPGFHLEGSKVVKNTEAWLARRNFGGTDAQYASAQTKLAAERRANDAEAHRENVVAQVYENALLSSGAPVGSAGRIVSRSGQGGSSFEELGAAVASKKDAAVSSVSRERATWLAALARARKTGLYKAAFAAQLPGFDANDLTPEELAEWRKVRSQKHDATNRGRILSVIGDVKYALLALPVIGWAAAVAFPTITAATTAATTSGTLSGTYATGAANLVASPAYGQNFLTPSAELGTAQNAQQVRQGLADEGKAVANVAASAAGAELGAVAAQGASFAGASSFMAAAQGSAVSTGMKLGETAADFGLDEAADNPNAILNGEKGAATAVASGVGRIVTRGF